MDDVSLGSRRLSRERMLSDLSRSVVARSSVVKGWGACFREVKLRMRGSFV